jgi:hypothetical protein
MVALRKTNMIKGINFVNFNTLCNFDDAELAFDPNKT